MITSFEVAALFSIEDDASGPLLAIAEAMEKVSSLAMEAKAALSEAASVRFGGVSRSLDKLAESIGALNRAATSMSEGLAATAEAVTVSARTTAEQVDGIAAAYDRAAAAEERFREQAQRPLAIPERVYEGEIGGPDVVPYGQRPAAAYRRPGGPTIDGEFSEYRSGPPSLGYGGQLALGYAGEATPEAEPGTGLPVVMPRGFGRGHAGTETPYQGGGRNPYTGPDSGPTINVGGRPHDPSLDIPTPPQGLENEWRGGPYGRGLPPVVPPVGGGGGGGGGRRGSDGVIHFGLAEMAADWAVGDALKSAAEEENAITRTLIGLQIDPASAEGQAAAMKLRQTYRSASDNTLYSEKNTAMAGAVFAREIGFTGAEGGVQKFQNMFPIALRSAEISQQEGLGDLDSSLTANLEYAHMTGRYDQKGYTKALNVLQQVATLTDNTVAGEEGILKYSVPIGRAGGMDPDKVAEVTGFLQQSGFNSSTAGTGLSQLMLGVLQSGGGISAHLEGGRRNAERELTNALHLSPADQAAGRKEAHGSAHVQALREMGITDAKGNLTVLNEHGGLNLDALFKDISAFAQTHSPTDTLRAYHDAFGTRGERIAGIMNDPAALARLQRFESNVDTGAEKFSAENVQNILSETTEQKFQQAMARLADAANAAATPLLGIAKSMLTGVVGGLNFVDHELQENPVPAGILGGAAVGGAAYGTFRVGKGAIRVARKVLSHITGGGGGAAAEAAEGAEAVEAVASGGGLLAGLAGLAPWLGIGALATGTGLGLGHVATAVDARVPALRRLDNWTEGILGHLNPFSSGGSAAVSPATATAAAAGTSGARITINVGPITLNGVGADLRPMVEKMFHELADKLGQSLTHASSSGSGSTHSAFANGAFP